MQSPYLGRVPMATSTTRLPSKAYDLDISIVSAKHLKNVNWSRGDLKPYCIFWVDPNHRHSTKSDDSGSTQPVWNERFIIPLTLPPQESFLTLEIFHSKPSETPKPLVGTLRLELKDFIDADSPKLKAELLRPSGRPQGKIHLKLAVRERQVPDYQFTPPSSYYYSVAPPLSRDYRGYSASPYTSHPSPSPPVVPPPRQPSQPVPSPSPPPLSYPYTGYSDPYSSYYNGYYSQQPPGPPPPPRPSFERHSSYGASGPSAPMEYVYVPPDKRYGGSGPSALAEYVPYDKRFGGSGPSAPAEYVPYDKRGGKVGVGTGLAVGAVAGALGGLALEEGLKYEEEKIADRVETDLTGRDDYSDYPVEY